MAAIKWTKNTLTPGLAMLPDKTKAALLMYAKTKAEYLKAQMKINRPWTDRTGMAKATLDANVTSSATKITIILSHGVDYGLWLELAHGKNYAIIKPTLDKEGPSYFKSMNNLFNKIVVY